MLGKFLGFVIGREPVASGAVIAAVLGLAVAFGADLSAEQTAAITSVAVVLIGWFARSAVTPVHQPTEGPVDAPGVPQ
jgi:hypothetical protein